MSTDNLDTLFEDLQGQFDVNEPRSGHQQRFMKKLNAESPIAEDQSKLFNLWKPFLAIAASLVLILTLTINRQGDSNVNALASVSPEMETTQDYFTTAIASELEKLNEVDNPEFQKLIVDALFQIKILEEDYQKLTVDLEESGNDKRVIHAMILNFQNRIDILTNVTEQIDELKTLKEIENENSSTL